jgi:hypothetical protein
MKNFLYSVEDCLSRHQLCKLVEIRCRDVGIDYFNHLVVHLQAAFVAIVEVIQLQLHSKLRWRGEAIERSKRVLTDGDICIRNRHESKVWSVVVVFIVIPASNFFINVNVVAEVIIVVVFFIIVRGDKSGVRIILIIDLFFVDLFIITGCIISASTPIFALYTAAEMTQF